jgi:hypothetical protein
LIDMPGTASRFIPPKTSRSVPHNDCYPPPGASADRTFEEISWADKTDAAIAWFADQKAAQGSAVAASSLGIHVVMGPEFLEMAANLGRNLVEGRARLIQAIGRRI